MREYNQKIIKFDHGKNFESKDFYVSKSNEHIFNTLNNKHANYLFIYNTTKVSVSMT